MTGNPIAKARKKPKPGAKRQRDRAFPSPHAFAYTISDAQSMGLGGRTSIWKMRQSGELKTIKVAGRELLIGDSVREVLGVKNDDDKI
jgi:hypothetical protein